MSSLTLLIIFIALAIGSLIVVSLLDEREKRQKVIRQRLQQIKILANDLEETVMAIDNLVETRAIPKLLNEEIIEMLIEIKDAYPQATHLQAAYRSAISRQDRLNDESEIRHLDRLKESDKQIALAQAQLNAAGRIIRKQHSSGKITIYEMNTFISELAWSHLLIEVFTLIGQGHRAINREEDLSGHAFYKKALQLLAKSKHPTPKRQVMITEITEMIEGKRKALSLDLMPETQLNPVSDHDNSKPLDI
jgi:hypothetical protein